MTHEKQGEAGTPHVWRGPTIKAIVRASGVGRATVDRVVNGRPGVRPVTRTKVLDAIARLDREASEGGEQRRRIAVLTNSGVGFNQLLSDAVEYFRQTHPTFECHFTAVETVQVDPVRFAQLIERSAEEAEGIIVVTREDVTINRAIRATVKRGVPVVCVTTDLPNSNRTAYVGCDGAIAGATAAYLLGRVVGERTGKILLVVSAPFRSQEDRELGFRRILRSEFPRLKIDERVNSKDDSESSYANVQKYIEEHGAPMAIYNVAGGNRGVARALGEAGLTGKVLFIGHELNAYSRALLEAGEMDFVISHDIRTELAMSINEIEAFLGGRQPINAPPTPVLIYTKVNCN